MRSVQVVGHGKIIYSQPHLNTADLLLSCTAVIINIAFLLILGLFIYYLKIYWTSFKQTQYCGFRL